MLRTPNTLKLYRDVLRDMETEALEQMKSFYDQFEGELEGHALTPEDLKGGARGIGSYFRKLRDGRLSDKDVLNATLQNSLTDAKNWATKTSSRKDDIIRLAETSLMPLLQEAERMRPQRNRTLNSCRLSLQHLNKLQPSQSYRRRGTHAKTGSTTAFCSRIPTPYCTNWCARVTLRSSSRKSAPTYATS